MTIKKFSMRLLCATSLALCAATVHAQSFPDRPVTLYNAYSAGGSSSVAFRVLAEAAAKTLGKRVIVEDKPGAGGALAPANMARMAKPDGYTLSQLPQPLLRIPHIQSVNYDVLNDFTWIIRVVDYTYGMVVKADPRWKSLNELLVYAKAIPGKITYATSGVGVTMHLAMENLAALQGIKWVHVPHRTLSDMISGTLGGQIDVVASSVGWGQMVETGKLRVLCILGANRVKHYPDVPTAKELGYDVLASSSYGIGGPKGMDPKVVKILHDAFKKGLDDADFMRTMDRLDQVTSYLNTADYTRWAREQYAAEKIIVERFGLKQ